MNTSFVMKQVGKGAGSIALAAAACLFAAYVRQAFGGWAFAGSLLLVIAASIPMVLFFNLFADPNAKRSNKVRLMDEKESHNPFNDMFNNFHRDD
ncbi:hypothetical protein AYO08_09860 [Pseudomonas putida]|uniref:hypothetical protein n=1 Tax=Pseudomonas TaxID=286 RepID=UPI0007DC2702|nr:MULTISPECIES: hypothetical protein [Pseudomonas]OAS07637.1 hypothetical protein AYO08_09860 [Pseudomonas putida]OOV91619.1 hypothetical protein MF6396_26370 [Pseudomonas sp. MF6396]QNV69531.1 hypothetical protein F7661_28995 [Pseudomonas sp. CFA]